MSGALQPDRLTPGWLRYAFDASPVGIGLIDADLRLVEANPRFWAIVGCAAPGDSSPVPLADVLGDDAGPLLRAVDGAIVGGRPFEGVTLALPASADGRVVLVSGHAIDARGVAISVVDITERHRHDEQLSGSFLRLSSAFAGAFTPAAIGQAVISAGRDGAGASAGALYLLDPSGTRLVPTGITDGGSSPQHPPTQLLVSAPLPLCAAVRDGRSVWVRDRVEMRERFPAYVEVTPPGVAEGGHVAVPILDGIDVVGGIVFTWTGGRRVESTDRLYLDAIAAQCAQALRRADILASERAAREHVERSADHVLRVERITGILASASAPAEVIDRFLDDCLPVLGVTHAVVFELDPVEGSLRPTAASASGHGGPDEHGGPVALDGASVVAQAIRSRQPVLVDDVAAVPLMAYGELLGAVVVRGDVDRLFDADDRGFLDRVGRRLAEALDRARLYARQRDAREQAEAAARWLRSVQSMAAALARSATRRDVARGLREHLHPATRADYSIVAALTGDGGSFDVLTAASTATVSTSQVAAAQRGPVRDALLRGRSVELVGLDEVGSVFPNLARAGIGSFVLLPIRSGRNLIATLGVGWSSTEAITAEARRLLSIAVSLGGAAFERAAAYDLDHHIAETLQRHLLTEPTTAVPGVAWAARYAPGAVELTAGGDWYDVIELPGGRVGLAVGDIVGHGITAAAAMGQIRSATRALAMREDPVGVLDALETFATATGQGNLSSLAYAVLDPATETLELAVAGHPPPLLRFPDGTTELVHEARGPLLGIAVQGPRTSVRRHLPRGSSVVFCTDGLIERRGESIDVGLARLADSIGATACSLHPEGVCDRLLADLVIDGVAADDITLLALSFGRPEGRFERSYPARPELLRVIRNDTRAWLLENDIRGDAANDILLAVGEATANAIDHGAGRDDGQVVTVLLAVEPGTGEVGRHAVVTVHDAGRWPEDRRVAQRGHGLDIMGSIMTSVDIDSNRDGTTVTMRRSADA